MKHPDNYNSSKNTVLENNRDGFDLAVINLAYNTYTKREPADLDSIANSPVCKPNHNSSSYVWIVSLHIYIFDNTVDNPLAMFLFVPLKETDITAVSSTFSYLLRLS